MGETDTGDELTSARVRTAQVVAAALLACMLMWAAPLRHNRADPPTLASQ